MQYERQVKRLLTLSLHRCTILVYEHLSAIKQLAQEICDAPDNVVPGARVEELMAAGKDAVPAAVLENLPFKKLLPPEVRPAAPCLPWQRCCWTNCCCTMSWDLSVCSSSNDRTVGDAEQCATVHCLPIVSGATVV